MRVTQIVPAIVLAGALAATWAGPAIASRYVPEPVSTVGPQQTATLQSMFGAEVTFEAPVGWSTGPATEPNAITYTRPTDRQQLRVSVSSGSKNFDTTADRILRESSVGGMTAAFDGRRVTSASGFEGKHCVAIQPTVKATGPCVVVHRGPVVVAVMATSTSTDAAPDLQGLLDSLKVTKEDSE